MPLGTLNQLVLCLDSEIDLRKVEFLADWSRMHDRTSVRVSQDSVLEPHLGSEGRRAEEAYSSGGQPFELLLYVCHLDHQDDVGASHFTVDRNLEPADLSPPFRVRDRNSRMFRH